MRETLPENNLKFELKNTENDKSKNKQIIIGKIIKKLNSKNKI